MLSVNKYDEGACYLENDFRNTFLFNISQNAYDILISADKIKFAKEIHTNFATGEIDWDKDLRLELGFIGSIKIISAIENYFKLVLLHNNCIIHEIKKEKAKELYDKQKNKPVTIKEVLIHEKTLGPIPRDYVFTSLKNNTITISKILGSPNYIDLMKLDSNNMKFISELNKQRNFLHFASKTESVMSNEINLGYLELRSNIIQELILLNNEFGEKMKISEKAFLKNRL